MKQVKVLDKHNSKITGMQGEALCVQNSNIVINFCVFRATKVVIDWELTLIW